MIHTFERSLARLSHSNASDRRDFAKKENLRLLENRGEAAVYVQDEKKEVYIVHRGTARRKDISTDVALLLGSHKFHPRFHRAKKVTKKVHEQLPDYKVTQVGYSLGGALAQETGRKKDKIVTFKKGAGVMELGRKRKPNQTDYVNVFDPISFGSLGQQGGKQIRSKKLQLNVHTIRDDYEFI